MKLNLESTPAECDTEDIQCSRDPLYLFGCYVEWRRRADSTAYSELVAASGDGDPNTRMVARGLLQRASPGTKYAELSRKTKQPEGNDRNDISHQ